MESIDLGILISEMGKILMASVAASIVTEIIKRSSLKEWRDNKYYGLTVNAIALFLSVFLVFVAQRLGWILGGWEMLVFATIFTWGLSVLEYEVIKNILMRQTGVESGKDEN